MQTGGIWMHRGFFLENLRNCRSLVFKSYKMIKLTPQEEQLMIAIWKVGEGHVKGYMEHMPNPGPYTTVASTIKNLEKKEYIAGRLFGNTYVYKPLVSEEEYKKKFMGRNNKRRLAILIKGSLSRENQFFHYTPLQSVQEMRQLVDYSHISMKG